MRRTRFSKEEYGGNNNPRGISVSHGDATVNRGTMRPAFLCSCGFPLPLNTLDFKPYLIANEIGHFALVRLIECRQIED